MDDNKNLKLFENKRVRTAWDEEKEEWLFSIVDVIQVLTDNERPRKYWSDLKSKLKAEGSELSEKIGQLKMLAEDGKMRLTDVGNTTQVLRLIQSIPSPKAEPFKIWLATVGAERIDEVVDPEVAIDRAFATYLRKGYSKEWVNQRILTLRVRNELVSEWVESGVKEGKEYAILTDDISKAWSGMTTRQYKDFKGLRQENLRDNMTTLELVLNMLAETTTTELSKKEKPKTFEENRKVAKDGGTIAGDTRKAIEKRTGKPVITSKKAIDFTRLLTDIIEYKVEENKNDKNKDEDKT